MTDPHSPEKAPLEMTREEYMRADGFVLYTAMNVRLLDEVRAETLRPATANPRTREAAKALHISTGVNQSNAGLYIATNTFVNSSTIIPAGNYSQSGLQEIFGISNDDLLGTEGKGIYQYGIEDRGFPWNFAAGVAAGAVHAFVRDRRIEPEAAANLGLGDWANLIGSVWFSKIMHSLAFTHNSIYQHFGAEPADFGEISLVRQLNDRLHYAYAVTDEEIDTALDTAVEYEPDFDEWHYTAKLNPAARAVLRQAMNSENTVGVSSRRSTGCPVARKVTRLPRESALTNPHVADLVDRGIFSIVPDSTAGYVQLEQPLTAIDRTLMLHAEKLEEYDRRFGMPIPTADGHTGTALYHQKMPPTSALILKGSVEA